MIKEQKPQKSSQFVMLSYSVFSALQGTPDLIKLSMLKIPVYKDGKADKDQGQTMQISSLAEPSFICFSFLHLKFKSSTEEVILCREVTTVPPNDKSEYMIILNKPIAHNQNCITVPFFLVMPWLFLSKGNDFAKLDMMRLSVQLHQKPDHKNTTRA